jgi:hypothetical protein
MRSSSVPLWSLAVLAAATLCGPASAQVACTSGGEWRRVDEGAFSFELPDLFARVDTQGVDSQVGAFGSPSMRVAYDYGFWLTWLGDDLQAPGPHQQHAVIDGHQAIIVSAPRDLSGRNEYRLLRAIQFELPPTELASRNRYLTVTVQFNDGCDEEVARRIVGSILFKRVPSA